MPRSIRNFLPGATYFFTLALQDRESYLLVHEIARLREAYARVQRTHGFDTIAICILPEHLHAIWKLPEGGADVPRCWGEIQAGFSAGLQANPPAASPARRPEEGIWQRRYWEHQIRDEEDFGRHIEHIHLNPVRHGWCRQVRDWPFSSFHRWVRRGELPRGWGLVRAAGEGQFGEPHLQGA